MTIWKKLIRAAALLAVSSLAWAQGFTPPPFVAGVPGLAQMQAIQLQRHQARTLLYREALEELRRNPQIVTVRACAADDADTTLCLPEPAPPGRIAALAERPTGRRLALLIGNDRYQAPIPPLLSPPRDVDAVARVLRERLGFETRVLKNAGKSETIRAVAALARAAAVEDSVLIYYAGHGYQMDDTGMGYWIPVDGTVKSAAQWISNDDIAKLLAAVPARQLMLVSDSCFSGTLAQERAPGTPQQPQAVLRKRSVLVLSSGGEEPVSDEGRAGHSVFAWHLLQTLEGLDDTRIGFEVYRVVRQGVHAEFPQTPQYGAVVSAGHEAGGDYLFEMPRP